MYCSLFMPRMENYQGDLTDIVRASGGAYGSTGAEGASEPSPGWRFPSDPMNFSSVVGEPRDNFGDPFSYMRDPLLYELDVSGSGFFSSTSSAEMMGSSTAASVEDTGGFNGGNTTGAVVGVGGASTSTILAPSNYLEDEMKRPCNIFSRMLQISPNAKLSVSPCGSPVMAAAASPRGIKASAMVAGDMITANRPKGCFIDNTGVQISPPRNPGIKRRKSQAKKVVCIPAPAAANSRPTGEVVPSDLWAWRKYGQKPIKGSPYPRGYYRCSSSKGCSARKQVERSRTDPNMLVITYTSEHNHPWPTQRNALAGSTRSQPSKSNAASKNFQGAQSGQKPTSPKEEQKESSIDDHVSPIVGGSSTTSASVKEELDEVEKQVLEMDDGEFSTAEGFSYRPTMPVSNLQSDQDFFAELEEIEADPLDLLFSQGFAGDHALKDSKGMDPFSLFDWPGDSGQGGTNPFGEAKNRGL